MTTQERRDKHLGSNFETVYTDMGITGDGIEYVKALEAEIDRLTQALRFYAEPYTWARVCADSRHMGAIGDFDFNHMYGAKAREALG